MSSQSYAYDEAEMLRGILSYKAERQPAVRRTYRQSCCVKLDPPFRIYTPRVPLESFEALPERARCICEAVSVAFGLVGTEITALYGGHRIMRPRQTAMYLLSQAGFSKGSISRMLSMDPTTIIYGVKITRQRMAEDEAFRKTVEALMGSQERAA